MQSKLVIFVVISFLVATLIYSSYARFDVFAAAVKRGPIQCTPVHNAVKCCQNETDKKGIEIRWCTICDDTNPPSNCSPRYQALQSGLDTSTGVQSGGVLQQPPTPPKPGGTASPKGSAVLEQPSTDQGTSGGNTGNNSK